jgi:cobaltochelatase CobT
MYDELAATLRALSGRPGLEVKVTRLLSAAGVFEIQTEQNSVELLLPEEKLNPAQFAAIRGMADREALNLRYHDAALHNKLLGRYGSKERAMLERAEIARITALGGQGRKGVMENLQAWQSYGYVSNQETLDPLTETFGLVLEQELTGARLPDAAIPIMQLHGDFMRLMVMPETEKLLAVLDDQEAFIALVRKLIQRMGKNAKQQEKPQEQEEEEEETTEESSPEEVPIEEGGGESSLAQSGQKTDQEPDQTEDPKTQHGQPRDGDSEAESGEANRPTVKALELPVYKIFTTEFDEIKTADELASPEELVRLRLQLDRKLEEQKDITHKLAAKLKRLLLAHQLYAWEYGLEEGMLDSLKFPQLIADPAFSFIHKQQKPMTYRDTSVTFLIDNSGSMRGRPIWVAALCADILARALERCHIKTEILGFTTAEWKGGKSRQAWMKNGMPRDPGRLNDLRHIIYKPADQPYIRARKNLALMLKEGLLKENIDGEAVLWAHRRLLERPEERRILMVISDGAPVDDATLSSNDGAYLDRHLHEVIKSIEHFSPVELVAIGIGHDVKAYYQKAATIRDVSELGDAMVDQLTELFSEQPSAKKIA